MAVRFFVLTLTALSIDAFFLDTIKQGQYNSYNNIEPCNHIQNLINEWAKRREYDAVRHIYSFILNRQRNHNDKRYSYSSDLDEAFYHHNSDPDENRLRDLITHNTEPGCLNKLQTFCEGLLHIQQHSHVTTTHKPTEKPTEKPTTTVQVTTQPITTKKPVTTTMPPATTTMPPATTTMPPATTNMPGSTLPPLNLKTCDPLAFVMVLANGNQVLNDNAGLCTDGTHSAPEAVVMQTCKAPVPSAWTAGPKVLENCARIPAYTPIATFEFGQYNLDSSSLSGIFVECTDDGFKIAAQLCGHGPEIFTLHRGGSTLRQNPDSYYVINI